MMAAALFPELQDDDREALIDRFGDESRNVFASLAEHDKALPCTTDLPSAWTDVLVPNLTGCREGVFAALLAPIAAPHAETVDTVVREAGLERAITRQASQAILSALVQTALRPVVGLLREMSAAGDLEGDTPEARFDDFERALGIVEVQQRLDDAYPILLPTLHQVAQRAGSNIVRLLEDLTTDSAALRAAGLLPANVVALDIDAGDTHAGGRAVAILDLADGSRLVYKPRPLAVDMAFNALLQRVNELAGTRLLTPPALDRGDHGWARYLSTELPADRSAEDRYFEQSGQLLAVAHLLGAADLHQENLVCHAGSPVLVDLETVMHPRLAPASPEGATAMDDLEDGVSATGLLPYVVVHDGQAADVGALGTSEGVMSPYKSLVVRNPGRDDMEAVLEQVPMPAGHPTPTVPSDDERAVEVCLLVQRGFSSVYRALSEHRESLADEVLQLFDGAHVRLIVNQTATYSQLLRMASHPLMFRDTRLRLAGLQRIGLWGGDGRPGINRAELRDLAQGDVPSFTVACGDTAVLGSDGVPVGEHVRLAPSLAAARRIRNMDEEALQRQLWRISDVLVGRFPTVHEETRAHREGGDGRDWSSDALRLVREVADALTRDQRAALRVGEPATWVGPRLDHAVSGWLPDILLPDLYAGSLGPAILLAHAARVTGDPRHADAALRVLDPLAEALADGRLLEESRRTARVGVYSGLAGSHLALALAARAMDRPDWRRAVDLQLDSLAGEVANAEALDHLDGAAGTLALAVLLGQGSTGPAASAARRLAITCQARLDERLGTSTADGLLRYGGFAHGVAGARLALARAVQRFGLPDGGLDAQLLGELELFHDDEHDIYTATRESVGAPVGWCHGVVGVAMAHAVADRHGLQASPTAERDLRRAAQMVLDHGLGSSMTYCHGDVGNVEVLGSVAQSLDDASLALDARRLTGHLLRDVLPVALRDQLNRNAHSPGLMLGSSGVAWFALRALDPDLAPDLLSLDWTP